jgi:hypothetical protein
VADVLRGTLELEMAASEIQDTTLRGMSPDQVRKRIEERRESMTLVRRVLGIAMVVLLVLAIFGGGWLVGRLGIGSAVNPASLSDAERQFTERMRDVSLVGSFTVAGYGDHYAGTWQHRWRSDVRTYRKADAEGGMTSCGRTRSPSARIGVAGDPKP